MFSAKLTRAAHRAAISSCTCPAAASSSASAATQCLAAAGPPRPHQRRASSSKASCPPDSTTGGKPTPATKPAAETQADRPAAQKSSKTRGRGNAGVKRLHAQHASKLADSTPVDHFAGLPSVPSIQNLNASDLGLSSFFSLHRPLSLASPLPPPTSTEAFNSIFASSPEQDAWQNGDSARRRPEDIIIALQQTIDSLEGSRSQDESEAVRWKVIYQDDASAVKHLDGLPRLKSLDELVAQFRPFRAPPPPLPFTEAVQAGQQQQQQRARKARKPRTGVPRAIRSNAASLAHEEAASILDPSPSAAIRDPSPTHARRPFLERMRRRRQTYLTKQLSHPQTLRALWRRTPPAAIRRAPLQRGQPLSHMQLISVKRQRKLKMKKHKYKKLMRRTRNLRRRLDRN